MNFSNFKNILLSAFVGTALFFSSCSKTPLGESAVGTWTVSNMNQTDSLVNSYTLKDNNGVVLGSSSIKNMSTLTFNGSNGTYKGNYSTITTIGSATNTYTGVEDATLTNTTKITLNADGTANVSTNDELISANTTYNNDDAKFYIQKKYSYTTDNASSTNSTFSWSWQDYKDTDKRQVLILNGESWYVTELTDNTLKLSMNKTTSVVKANSSEVKVVHKTMALTK